MKGFCMLVLVCLLEGGLARPFFGILPSLISTTGQILEDKVTGLGDIGKLTMGVGNTGAQFATSAASIGTQMGTDIGKEVIAGATGMANTGLQTTQSLAHNGLAIIDALGNVFFPLKPILSAGAQIGTGIVDGAIGLGAGAVNTADAIGTTGLNTVNGLVQTGSGLASGLSSTGLAVGSTGVDLVTGTINGGIQGAVDTLTTALTPSTSTSGSTAGTTTDATSGSTATSGTTSGATTTTDATSGTTSGATTTTDATSGTTSGTSTSTV